MTLASNFFVTVNSDATRASLGGMRSRLMAKLAVTMQRLGLELLTRVKEDKLSGQVLNVRTGTLRRSINLKMEVGNDSIKATVGTNVPYAAIHEFGGTVPAVDGKLMVFPAPGLGKSFVTQTGRLRAKFGGRADLLVFTKKHKAFNLPERSFLRSALEDMAPRIEEQINAAVAEAIRG